VAGLAQRRPFEHENPLRMLNMTAGQQVLRRLDSAFKAFFQGKRGFPRFKKASRFNSVNYKPGDGASIRGRKLYVQNAGLITVRWHRELPDGKLKNIILLRKPSGWYVCFQVEHNQSQSVVPARPSASTWASRTR
jgi:putative transposase